MSLYCRLNFKLNSIACMKIQCSFATFSDFTDFSLFFLLELLVFCARSKFLVL